MAVESGRFALTFQALWRCNIRGGIAAPITGSKMRTTFCLLAALWVSCASANTIALWTFETSIPNSAGPHVAEEGVNTPISNASSVHSSPDAIFIARVGNGSNWSFNSIDWNIGDYYQFQTSTLGFEAIKISFDQTSSRRGPRDFELQYSTDGASFTNFASYSVLPNVAPDFWDPPVHHPQYGFDFDLSSIAALNDRPIVYLRLLDTGTTSANGDSVLNVGTDRVDSFAISGISSSPAAIPLPAALIPGALLLVSVVCIRRSTSHH